MSAVSKINVFDKLATFDSADIASLQELDVFHPDFSQTEDLPTAKNLNKSYAQGLEEGRALAVQEGAMRVQEIGDLVQVLTTQLSTLAQDIQASHSRAISNIIRAVLPNLATQTASAEISRFITDISGQALSGIIELTINPASKPQVQTIVEALGQSGQVLSEFSIITDENIAGTALKAQWRSGGGSIDIDEAVKHCLSLLENET